MDLIKITRVNQEGVAPLAVIDQLVQELQKQGYKLLNPEYGHSQFAENYILQKETSSS